MLNVYVCLTHTLYLLLINVSSQYHLIVVRKFSFLCRSPEQDDPALEALCRSQPRSKEAFWSRVETFSVSFYLHCQTCYCHNNIHEKISPF